MIFPQINVMTKVEILSEPSKFSRMILQFLQSSRARQRRVESFDRHRPDSNPPLNPPLKRGTSCSGSIKNYELCIVHCAFITMVEADDTGVPSLLRHRHHVQGGLRREPPLHWHRHQRRPPAARPRPRRAEVPQPVLMALSKQDKNNGATIS